MSEQRTHEDVCRDPEIAVMDSTKLNKKNIRRILVEWFVLNYEGNF